MKPHKHAELIKAWADGAEIQHYNQTYGHWEDSDPRWSESRQYRIKPEEKKPVVRWLWTNENGLTTQHLFTEEQMKKNGLRHSYPIKIEWSRTEFPE